MVTDTDLRERLERLREPDSLADLRIRSMGWDWKLPDGLVDSDRH
jgi:hypothetical protein